MNPAFNIKDHIREVPDFPQPGILFYDISTLIAHPAAWQHTLAELEKAVAVYKPDLLLGIESRGFLATAPLASMMNLGFAMARKKGKLPGLTLAHTYDLEYGTTRSKFSPI